MTAEFIEKGWREITVKTFTVLSFHKKAFNMTAKEWLDNNKRLNLKKGMRSHCACCHTPWGKISGDLNCVMTDRGNQAVCDECFETLGGNK